jgi:hypothetical protein
MTTRATPERPVTRAPWSRYSSSIKPAWLARKVQATPNAPACKLRRMAQGYVVNTRPMVKPKMGLPTGSLLERDLCGARHRTAQFPFAINFRDGLAQSSIGVLLKRRKKVNRFNLMRIHSVRDANSENLLGYRRSWQAKAHLIARADVGKFLRIDFTE